MVRKCSIELAQTGADWRLKAPVCASAQVRKCSFKSTALALAQWRPAERYPEGTSVADMLWRSPGFTNKSLQRRLASSTVADRRTAAPPAYLFDAVRFCGGVCRVPTAFATTRGGWRLDVVIFVGHGPGGACRHPPGSCFGSRRRHPPGSCFGSRSLAEQLRNCPTHSANGSRNADVCWSGPCRPRRRPWICFGLWPPSEGGRRSAAWAGFLIGTAATRPLASGGRLHRSTVLPTMHRP